MNMAWGNIAEEQSAFRFGVAVFCIKVMLSILKIYTIFVFYHYCHARVNRPYNNPHYWQTAHSLYFLNPQNIE